MLDERMSLGVYIIWNSRVIVQFLIHSFTYNTRSLHSRIATITHWLELNDWQPANNSCKETRVGFRTEDFERHTRLIIGTLKITLLHPPLMNSKQCQQSLEWKGWGCLIYDTNRENSNLFNFLSKSAFTIFFSKPNAFIQTIQLTQNQRK